MGVKSLWNLLTPVGRPVMLETVEGKIMAIDSSIWIYQFQATMRDKDGRALVNAHVLGFLRRISKLLFYGIKPVFVFDGGAPALKRTTLKERREKKSGAAASHVKLAEKLLAAQLRREAFNHAHPGDAQAVKASKGKSKVPVGPAIQNDNTVYLEDLDSSMPKTPARKKAPEPSSSSKKDRFHDHDPYRLPEVDLEDAVAKASRSSAPDPRLATEDELRNFIEDMRPEDFDVTSPAFRELPTEVQYEIVGDLRLKSRQTSYARLQNMLKSAPTPLDFSKQQIKNLRQRNTLTQQLLITTDTIGSAHISIPIRIASERNKEYVLMKNEGETGGWILGIRDDGTQQKPIEIDQDNDKEFEEDSDAEMEEVDISGGVAPDSDLRDYQRHMALAAIANRYTPKGLAPLTTKPIDRKPKSKPLFELDDDETLPSFPPEDMGEDDEMLALAVQESLDQAQIAKEAPQAERLSMQTEASSSTSSLGAQVIPASRDSYDRSLGPPDRPLERASIFTSPTRLQTALSIANAGPPRSQSYTSQKASVSSFGQPVLLSHFHHQSPASTASPSEDLEDISPQRPSPRPSSPSVERSDHIFTPLYTSPAVASDMDGKSSVLPVSEHGAPSLPMLSESPYYHQPVTTVEDGSDSEENMEEVISTAFPYTPAAAEHMDEDLSTQEAIAVLSTTAKHLPESEHSRSHVPLFDDSRGDEEEPFVSWSRSPSPLHEPSGHSAAAHISSPIGENWDPVEEMDVHAEDGEFARFISQVKGKDIEHVRREIDDEIKSLNQQRKAAMRDSEDITQQMISQIMTMLRLFGIPYITAPMEAEAQCAELVSLELVDGVITDDSDVFLFGAQRVFKNMFNQSKTVECFLLSDLSRELGLERDTLIRLAYLLGSDYVDGLPGVGPVVAMELLKEFPGEGGLHKFKDWWLRVQTGRDREDDNKSKFRKQFKKKFKDLYLPNEWPNPAVRDAYYHPTVDSSDEPFKWGLPDLDALREFFREELGWGQGKVDEIMLPIIQKMNKRGQAAAMNKQSNLNEFFDVNAGSGTFAPRKRQAYTSKRLQQVVTDFRNKRKNGPGSPSPVNSAGPQSRSGSEGEVASVKKRKKTADDTKSKGKARPKKNVQRVQGGNSRAKKGVSPDDDDEFLAADEPGKTEIDIPPDPVVVARLRPRPKPVYKRTQDIVNDPDVD